VVSFDNPQFGGVKSGEAGVIPDPDKATVVGEFVASLVIVAVPVVLPVAMGENDTVSEAAWLGSRTIPEDTPSTLNPVPDDDTPDIVAFALPVFVTVTTWLPLCPITTFTKLTLVGLAESTADEGGGGG
jgi:hypothetical protein